MSVFTRGYTRKRQVKHWHYSFMIDGKRYRGAIKEARTRAEAERAETQIRHEVYEGRYGKASLGEASLPGYIINSYLPWAQTNKRSWMNDNRYCKAICQYFSGKTFKETDRKLIESFKEERRRSKTNAGKSRTAASVNREMEVLSKIFSLAIDDGMTDTNPCRLVKKLRMDNQRQRYLTVAEEERMMKALSGRRAGLKPLVLVALNTGMRRGELLNLRWEDVDLDRGMINVRKAKTDKGRVIPIDQTVRDALSSCDTEASRKAGWVFTNKYTKTKITDLKHGFTSACVQAKIANFRFHDLRHTFGTRLADSKVDIIRIGELMGHSSIQTTKRYCHATDEGKRAAIDQLARYKERHCLKIATKQERQAS